MLNRFPHSRLWDVEKVAALADLALACINQEHPNVLERTDPKVKPSKIHPAFYGCYDWHSAVHNHWTLVRFLRLFPNAPQANDIITALRKNLSAKNIRAEAAYLEQNEGFERMYGWTWLLKLAQELINWDTKEASMLIQNLEPLIDVIRELYQEFLPEHDKPDRSGSHNNTAFGLTFALDFAQDTGEQELETLIKEQALGYYQDDKNIPAEQEPNKWDFLSPSLVEADLMSRILNSKEFTKWFEGFLPTIPNTLLEPAIVSDHNDPLIGHLNGLNLSRAWCLENIAAHLNTHNGNYDILLEAAKRNGQAGLAHVFSGNYKSGGHWLASFALYYLSHQITLKD